MHLDVGRAHPLAEIDRLGRGVQHVALVAVHHLHADGDVALRRLGAEAADGVDRALDALLGRRNEVFLERRIEDAADVGRADVAGDAQRIQQQRLAALDLVRIAAGDVAGGVEAERHGDAELVLLERAAGEIDVDRLGVERRESRSGRSRAPRSGRWPWRTPRGSSRRPTPAHARRACSWQSSQSSAGNSAAGKTFFSLSQ